MDASTVPDEVGPASDSLSQSPAPCRTQMSSPALDRVHLASPAYKAAPYPSYARLRGAHDRSANGDLHSDRPKLKR